MNLETDFKYQTLPLSPDYEGEVNATLISSKLNTGVRKSVLYIHGFIDYFFHPHLAEHFIQNGFDFYALDLRKYGRSLLPHQRPNYCRDIEEYFEEISLALQHIHSTEPTAIYMLGHSTGGLIASNYMNTGPERNLVQGLILNSPFFDFNKSGFEKKLIPLVARIASTILPNSKVKRAISPVYSQSIYKKFKGEWDYNLDWKPAEGFPTYYIWLLAISNAQKKLNHSDIKVPILVMHSAKSGNSKKGLNEALNSDIVLNIEDMKRVGAKLGDQVTFIKIENGMHDLFLSRKEVRENAIEEMFGWLRSTYSFN